MDPSLILAAVIPLILLLWWAFSRTAGPPTSASMVSRGVSITPAPLLSETHMLLYNLLRLAVHDRYLVLAQIPLWSFVEIEAPGRLRARIYGQIALKRVDFALVHPGSRQVEQVVQIEDASDPRQEERQRIIASTLEAVGIPLRMVRPKASYSVTDLTALLELEPEG